MTEERMIRVISWQLCPNRLYDDRTERICKLTNNPCGLECLNSRCPLEPAPLKDWKPVCFGTRPACFGGCIDEPECKVCPYREVEK